MNTNLVSYYRDRAKEYEKIYSKPERQDDLQSIASIVQEQFSGKSVLEIACGTGYWTEIIAKSAASVFATDINDAVVEVAKQKDYSKARVTFGLADIFNFNPDTKYESIFGGFIWSHIPRQDLDRFLSTVNNFIMPGGTVVFTDNNFVAGSNHPVTKTDEQGNTFQTRKLENGTTHLVLKNFPTESFLREKLTNIATDLKFINLTYYWILSYRTI
jgi:2-polyprenyl-3-methyl-5-hydroxy-6-metoxy-1,4-benzoquinol methylase